MTIDDAVDALCDDLTVEQRKLVAAALRRQTLAAVRALQMLATASDAASVEAIMAINQIRDSVR